LLHGDESIKTAHLHALLFILHETQFSASDLLDILQHLHTCVHEKRGEIASWALLAISRYVDVHSVGSNFCTYTATSCALQDSASSISSADWIQTWQTGARALVSSNTCRAASVQLHSLLDRNLILYHEIAEDVDAMATSTDTNGPASLSDASMTLMSHILSLRVIEAPGIISQVSQHVIRWLFRCWTPGKQSAF